MSFYYEDKNWTELKKAVKDNALILFPIGTIEEHGMHLPVGTDAVIAKETARLVAERMHKKIPVLVMPVFWSGYSAKEMSRWTGTIRVRTRVFMDAVFDVCSSLVEMGFKKIMIIDCHGHHTALINTVVREIADKHGVYIAQTWPHAFSKEIFSKIRKSKQGGAIHGGEWETSLMLYLNQPVNMKKTTKADIMRYHSEFIAGDNFSGSNKVFWSTWGIQKSKTGIYGDPTNASRETGRKLAEEIVRNYEKFIREFYR